MADPAVSRSVAREKLQQVRAKWRAMGESEHSASVSSWQGDRDSVERSKAYAARMDSEAWALIDDLLSALVVQEAPQEIRRAFEAGFTARYDEIEEEWFFASYIHPAVRVEKDGIDAAWTAYQAYLAAPPQEVK